MTKRCCWCKTPHIIGPDLGEPYSDGLCWWAALKEDVKWYAPIWGRHIEQVILPLTLVYLVAQLVRWGMEGFRVVG